MWGVWDSSARLPINTPVDLVRTQSIPSRSTNNNKPVVEKGITESCGFLCSIIYPVISSIVLQKYIVVTKWENPAIASLFFNSRTDLKAEYWAGLNIIPSYFETYVQRWHMNNLGFLFVFVCLNQIMAVDFLCNNNSISLSFRLLSLLMKFDHCPLNAKKCKTNISCFFQVKVRSVVRTEDRDWE